MHNPLAPATMLRHKKQCHGTMHYAAAPKQHGITNSSAAAPKKRFGMPNAAAHHAILWHIAPCLGISHNNAVAHKKGPRHKAQHHGTKNIACGTLPMPWHKKSSMEQSTTPRHKKQHMVQCCSTLWKAVAQSTMPQH